MVWLLGICIFIFLIYKFPAFRIFIFIAAVILGLLIAWFIYDSNHQQEVAKSIIPINQIQLTNMRVGSGNLYELTGEVKNNSNHELIGINLMVKAFDCPGNSITSDCVTIGQDNNVNIYMDVPSNQVREISSTFVSLSNMPPVKGTFLWSYEITGTTGK